MSAPLVDVIIPVHSSTRPIYRATSSVLAHTVAPVRVTVVAHNIDIEVIRENLGALAGDERVRLISLVDKIPSPAGPLNLGLAEATTRFVAVMGSDDEFEPGAIDSWLALQQATNAAMVIARIYHVGRGYDAFPPTRPHREVNLDPVKDRLAYRSAPLGLVDRERLGHLRFTEGLPSGEDLAYTLQVWFSGHPIALDGKGPAYRVHHDELDRVSFVPRSIHEDFAFLDHIIDTTWFKEMDHRSRSAIGVKLMRTQLFDAIAVRPPDHRWNQVDQEDLQNVISRIRAAAPGAERLLARVDREIIDAVMNRAFSSQTLHMILARRWNYRSPEAAVTRNPLYALHRQAPLRTLYAGYKMMKPRRGD